ncbi:hypothetical protein AZO1586R_668 [Bathymodiolus azoricus thioautotrophic gill symbiont]|uniref:Uncharacterized protein n=2 Tax=Bathymodiolus azoricus thioautotrophic gill symbiont TaxID=235205 RepID=A0ACA8ZT15_9GAMM|nr:hypothetical protein AZO1586R_668 [Bathymodiolus azoricus thioautotrophic gill symbiont]SEI05713.1 hypothetical protein BAZSYMA_ACONTIG261815_0 [Bathymodiolus azoricus thioautotrophic gill symbiont]
MLPFNICHDIEWVVLFLDLGYNLHSKTSYYLLLVNNKG